MDEFTSDLSAKRGSHGRRSCVAVHRLIHSLRNDTLSQGKE